MFSRHLSRGKQRLTKHASIQTYRTKPSDPPSPTPNRKTKERKIKTTIAPGSDQHHDLPTFLAYATRNSLSPTSTVYIGTHYEYTVASTLRSLGFTLTRTGRSSDYGIDLLGHWSIPSHPAPLRVLLQCKAHAKALNPANVRELEGAFVGAPAGWKGGGVLGFLVATGPATKGMRDALVRSRVPMGFLRITSDGKTLQFIWNHEATQIGLEGMGVTTRFMPLGGDRVGLEQEAALTWDGWVLSKEKLEASVAPVKRVPRKSTGISKKGSARDEPVPKKRGRPKKDEQESTVRASKTSKSGPTKKARKTVSELVIPVETNAEGKGKTLETLSSKSLV